MFANYIASLCLVLAFTVFSESIMCYVLIGVAGILSTGASVQYNELKEKIKKLESKGGASE
jgi:hypothetical protein